MKSSKRALRSQAWFSGHDRNAFIHRSWMRGFPADEFDGRPVIGICNTFSELTPCNAHLRDLAEHVKRGVWEAGGLPLEFPVTSLGETNIRPTAMILRNLASIDVEESIRCNPIDGVVLLVGCDKTTPALLMGAASCDVPAIVVSGGPMLRGTFRGRDIGSGTDVWRLSEEVRAGKLSMADLATAESGMNRSAGSCNTMGTASTMACLVEALGVALPGNGATPAVDSRRGVLAHLAGRRIVDLVKEDVRLSRILIKPAFENAIRLTAAIGGSTNAVVHLIAIAGRIGVDLNLDDWDRLGRSIPTLVNLMPSGQFLMEDFAYAGGLQAVVRQLLEARLLDGDLLTVNGKSIKENAGSAEVFNADVIRPVTAPLTANGGIAVLRGNLAPNGAVLKPSAATAELMQHTGRAVVFDSIDDFHARVDDPTLEIDASSIMVLRNCGPCGYPGMAEVGNMPLPAKLLARGVRDMVRISDARMSGTAYGTVVLHVAPEAAVGGPLALVQQGDQIVLDVAGRRLELLVDPGELERRRQAWRAPPSSRQGYQALYVKHVLQADRGCDFDFLVGCRGAPIPAESH
ncbi:MAG: IlvD/Edd family dehydratase [Steroidobacteraceae bacterium]|jgi:dihydroxy-acid dehydratase